MEKGKRAGENTNKMMKEVMDGSAMEWGVENYSNKNVEGVIYI